MSLNNAFSTEEFGLFIIRLIYSIKNENFRWQKENLYELPENEAKTKLLRQELEEEFTKREIKSKYELAQLEAQYDSSVKEFKDYLDAIDQIKDEIKKDFKNIPLPVVLSIHQYAKKLLLLMWNSDNIRERVTYEEKLFDFLYTLQEDIFLTSSQEINNNYLLPEKTINLITQNQNTEQKSNIQYQPKNTVQLTTQDHNIKQKSNIRYPSYIEIARSVVGGASLGAIIGTPFGFVGSAVGAGIGSIVIPFLVLKEESKIDSQSSIKKSDES